MLECLILGDSLAVGVGQVRTECVTRAKSGINSYNYVNRHILHTQGNTSAKNVIQHVTVNNLNVGRSPEETLRVLDALQTGELCACNRTVGGETL